MYKCKVATPRVKLTAPSRTAVLSGRSSCGTSPRLRAVRPAGPTQTRDGAGRCGGTCKPARRALPSMTSRRGDGDEHNLGAADVFYCRELTPRTESAQKGREHRPTWRAVPQSNPWRVAPIQTRRSSRRGQTWERQRGRGSHRRVPPSLGDLQQRRCQPRRAASREASGLHGRCARAGRAAS